MKERLLSYLLVGYALEKKSHHPQKLHFKFQKKKFLYFFTSEKSNFLKIAWHSFSECFFKGSVEQISCAQISRFLMTRDENVLWVFCF